MCVVFCKSLCTNFETDKIYVVFCKSFQVTDWTPNPSHGLDAQSNSQIGHPNLDSDWIILIIIQSKSGIGCPIHVRSGQLSNPTHGLDVQSVTPYCHGLDVPSKSRIGHPNRDLDWMILISVQSRNGLDVQSMTGLDSCPIPVTVWTSNPWQVWMTVQTVTYVCHRLDVVQTVTVWKY